MIVKCGFHGDGGHAGESNFFSIKVSEQTVIIPPCNTNCLGFITEKEDVYCALNTKSLNSKQVSFLLPRNNGFDPGPVDVRFVMGTLALKRGFLRVASPVSVIPPVLHAYSSSSM